MKNQSELSIILVNFNGLADTEECIDSLQEYVKFPCEIIIVDNGSKKNEAVMLQTRYPEVICIRSEKNLGFAGGNNLGIQKSHGKFIMLLNNDTIVKDDSIEFLIKRLKSAPEIGAVSSKIKFAFFPEIIQFAGITPLSKITFRNETIGNGETDKGQYNNPHPIPYLHGASMMIKREILKKAGLMPEIYFLYYEELDWSVRIKESGYMLYYEPRCTVFHKESRSTGIKSPLYYYYYTRNRLLFAARNGKGLNKYLSIIYQITIALPKNSLAFLLKGKFDLIKASFSGVFDFFLLKHKKRIVC